MHVIQIIPARRWRHLPSGRTASVYGACPWVSAAERTEWTQETTGYTWAMSDGTIGLCRVPAKTLEEAEAIADRVNMRARKVLEAHARMYPTKHNECMARIADIPLFASESA